MREKARRQALRITAQDLLEFARHRRDHPRAARRRAREPEAAAAKSLHDALVRQLDDLRRFKPDKLVRRRREKFLRMGQYLETE